MKHTYTFDSMPLYDSPSYTVKRKASEQIIEGTVTHISEARLVPDTDKPHTEQTLRADDVRALVAALSNRFDEQWYKTMQFANRYGTAPKGYNPLQHFLPEKS